nr:PAS domain-containing protein [Paenibacillus sp. MSJ-34]
MRGTTENGNRINYITQTKNGKILRSSTVYLKDIDKKMLELFVLI